MLINGIIRYYGCEKMDKKTFMVLSVLSMICASFSFAGPVAAATMVDHGTKYAWGDQGGWEKIVWKTYQYKYKKNGHYNNNYIKCYAAYYILNTDTNKYEFSYHETFTFAKVTPLTVKITDWTDSELGPGTTVTYDKTKLTAVQYYWRVYRSKILWES